MPQQVSEIVYDFIRSYYQRHHIPPTVREIADGCHLATTTAYYYLKQLRADGRISYQEKKARSILITDGVPQA